MKKLIDWFVRIVRNREMIMRSSLDDDECFNGQLHPLYLNVKLKTCFQTIADDCKTKIQVIIYN